MLTSYVFPKMKYSKKDTKEMYVFFDNGDYLEIKGIEIVDFSINSLYDKLVWRERGFCPVVESGYFKFKICNNKPAFTHLSHAVYNEYDFRKNRKGYIENRFINEGGINEIWLFDEFSWHKEIKCAAKAKMDGEFLLLEFIPQPQMGSTLSENHSVTISPVEKQVIDRIDLDFENCESFTVNNDEIQDINLEFASQLEWGAAEIYRKVIGGYIRVKLDSSYHRNYSFIVEQKTVKTSDFEKRLCGKKGESTHDICHLYVDFNHAGYGTQHTECIEVDDMKSDEELDKLEKLEEETGEEHCWFESGYCKKLNDGSIIIAFGKNAKATIDKLN